MNVSVVYQDRGPRRVIGEGGGLGFIPCLNAMEKPKIVQLKKKENERNMVHVTQRGTASLSTCPGQAGQAPS